MSYLKQYEYVIAIARRGGISQAADFLHVAQPTLSKYVKKLEEELGVELFDRSTIPLRLTEAGERFVAAGNRLIDMEHQLQKELQEIKMNKNTLVRIGISPSRSPYLMPAIVEAYRKENPQARILIKEGNTAELNRLLSCGDLDLIISLLDEESSVFERVELFEEDILVALSKSLCREQETAIDALTSHTLITVGRGLALWQTLSEIAQKLGAREPEIECQSIDSALALVKRGLGAMLVPSYVAQYGTDEQNRDLCFLRLPFERYPSWETDYRRRVCLFYRKEQFLAKAERRFIESVEQVVRETAQRATPLEICNSNH